MGKYRRPTLVDGEDTEAVRAQAAAIVGGWLQRFEAALAADTLELDDLFLPDGWLKDKLALSWDHRTLHGLPSITNFLREQRGAHLLSGLKPLASSKLHLQPHLKLMGPMAWLESAFSLNVPVGRGRGIVRLVNTAVGEWKAWVVYTTLEDLSVCPRERRFWGKKLEPVPDEPDAETEPTVLVIGAGHCGLSVAACLQELGVRTLLIDREQRVGNSWRKRYKSLVLHTPSWRDNMPFMDFPSGWPVFPTKDQVADFLEFYAKTLDLQVWLETEYSGARYDAATQRWTVETTTTDGRGRKRTLQPRHIVYAGNAHTMKHPTVPEWAQPGSHPFQGLMYHAGEHQEPVLERGMRGKRVVVVGSSASAHDICLEYVEAGAEVTMVQRGDCVVFSWQCGVRIAAPQPAEGVSSDDFAFATNAMPIHLIEDMTLDQGQKLLAHDADLIAGLKRTEFAVNDGSKESFFSRIYRMLSGIYINKGASDAIVDGRIRVLRCPEGVERLTPDGMVLADQRAVAADIIVLATGYRPFESVIDDIMGENVASGTNRNWGIDDEGEQASLYRPTGHPGFWIAIGNLMVSRMRAPLLALQIKATEAGLI